MARSTWVIVLVGCCACGRVGFDAVTSSPMPDAPTNTGRCATAVFTNPGASSFVDDFSTGVLTDRWMPVDPCIDQTGGEVVASPLPSGRYCHAWTKGDWHLSCDTITMHVPEVTTQTLGVQTYVYVQSVSGGPLMTLLLEGGGFQFVEAGIGAPYDPVTDAWWRIGERDGTVYFDGSPDGVTWTRQATAAAPFSLDHVEIAIGAGTYKAVSSPGQARFHCYNVAPPCT